MIMKYLSI